MWLTWRINCTRGFEGRITSQSPSLHLLDREGFVWPCAQTVPGADMISLSLHSIQERSNIHKTLSPEQDIHWGLSCSNLPNGYISVYVNTHTRMQRRLECQDNQQYDWLCNSRLLSLFMQITIWGELCIFNVSKCVRTDFGNQFKQRTLRWLPYLSFLTKSQSDMWNTSHQNEN